MVMLVELELLAEAREAEAEVPKARATAFLNAVELRTSQKLAALHMPIRLRWEVTSGYAEAQYEWKGNGNGMGF